MGQGSLAQRSLSSLYAAKSAKARVRKMQTREVEGTIFIPDAECGAEGSKMLGLPTVSQYTQLLEMRGLPFLSEEVRVLDMAPDSKEQEQE